MRTTLPLAFCLLLIAPATLNVADEAPKSRAEKAAEPPVSSVRQFSEEELSAARRSLADLTPQQRAVINHLRYLMRPRYEEELMAGRRFAACPLSPFETPGESFETADALRLWAVLASGVPVNEATKRWLGAFVDSPLPSAEESLGEHALNMAVCALAVRDGKAGMDEALKSRAERVVAAADKARSATSARSSLITANRIEPGWFANHLWRAVINRFALELELNINERTWESSVRDLLDVAHDTEGWRVSSSPRTASSDVDTNLFAMAALNLVITAPEGVIGKALLRSVERSTQNVPDILASLGDELAAAPTVGTRLAVLLSLGVSFAPEGLGADSWRASVVESSLNAQDPSGIVREGASVSRIAGFAVGRYSQRLCETALQCVALSGGLLGQSAPLAGMQVAEIGRAMHACSVIHAAQLPEGTRRVVTGVGHDLPEPRDIEKFMLSGLAYLAEGQHTDGGWGSAWSGRGNQSGSTDPGTTAFVAMAIMRAGHTPYHGEYQDAVLQATEYVVEAVENAADDGPRITEAKGTQLQSKLGQIVDTAVVTQFLARVLQHVESDPALYGRVEEALRKCITKIEENQNEDGGWITQGWAPVLQSAMFNQALELCELAGCSVDREVLERSRSYLGRDVEIDDGKTTTSKTARRGTSAGIAFYAGSSAMRATAGDAAEVTIAMNRAIKERKLPPGAEISEKNLRKIGYSDSVAEAKAAAWNQYEAMVNRLDDEKYLKGFGNNGGEEFISYMLSSESLVITGHDKWDAWNDKLYRTFEKIQNKDGSWSGHHCISSPVLCTAAVLMTLTADREPHVVVQNGPGDRTTSSRKDDKKSGKKTGGPTTGK